MGLRKSKGGGGSGGSTTNVRTVILGAISIVLALIMLGIAMDTVSPLLTGGASAVNWTNYPGGEPMLKLFPLIMTIGLIIFGGVLVWLGTTGKTMSIKDTIMVTLVVVVAVIMLPIIVDAADGVMERADIGTYTGLKSFLGLLPLLYTVGLMTISGLLGFRAVRGGSKGSGD